MAYRIMYEEAPMELDPYDEKALVIFGAVSYTHLISDGGPAQGCGCGRIF